jgi:hypothetical protein
MRAPQLNLFRSVRHDAFRSQAGSTLAGESTATAHVGMG